MSNKEEILRRSGQLQAQVEALGGQKPTPAQERKMLQELLEIRILELSNDLPQKEAIEQAYREQESYKGLAKSEESIKQFELLEKIKNELIQAQIAKEAQETPEEKKKREEANEEKKKKKEEKKKDNQESGNQLDGGGSYFSNDSQAGAGSDLANNSQCQAAFINTFSQSRYSLDPNNHASPEVGKAGNSTTLDLGGIKATIYRSGVHREMKLELPPNPTDEQKEKFNAALDKHKEYSNRGDYSLLSHNCVGAVAETLNSLAPDKFDASTRMPWSLDNQIKNELNQQLQQQSAQSIDQKTQQWINDAKNNLENSFKQNASPNQDKKISSDEKKESAKADGKNITDVNGEKYDIKEIEQAKAEASRQKNGAPTPPPPGGG